MALAEELHAQNLIKPYAELIIKSIKDAWQQWLKSPFFGKWSARGRASFVWETTIGLLKENFVTNNRVHVIDKGSTVLFVVEQQIIFRFKFADRNGRSKNVQTQSAKSFHDPEVNYNLLANTEMFSNIPRVEVVYTLNESATQIDNIKMIARDKSALVWDTSLIGSQNSFVEFDHNESSLEDEAVKQNSKARRFKGKSTIEPFKKAEGES